MIISLTIVELIWRSEGQILRLVMTDQSMLLPEPAMKSRQSVAAKCERAEEHTFSVDPQKRTSGLPFLENAILEEPLRCPLVVSTTAHIVVGG